MPTGEVSWHARNRAFDFLVPKNVDKRDVMVWLTKNSPGVTMSYRSSPHIHTDTGSFHKVIYNAANHEAGERAVAIWKARALLANATPPLPKPRPNSVAAGSMMLASADPVDPLHEYLESPADRMPGPITPSDRLGIFRRYFQSKEVMVMAHTTLMCPNGTPFPTELMRLLQDASSHFGRTAVVNSGYRTPERNRRVGGARNSQHMKCRAIDFRVAGVSVGDLRRYVMANLHKWGDPRSWHLRDASARRCRRSQDNACGDLDWRSQALRQAAASALRERRMIDPQQSGQRWELSPRINLGVLVNSMEGTRVRLAPFAGRVVGAVVSSIDWAACQAHAAGGAHSWRVRQRDPVGSRQACAAHRAPLQSRHVRQLHQLGPGQA